MTKILTIDIETIGTQSDEVKERIAANIKAPGQYKKPEAIEAWKVENIPEAISKTSLNAAYGHIVSIGFAFDNEAVSTVSWPLQHETEYDMLRYFAQFISTADRAPVLTGHNIIGFDLRFITQRCMVLGIKLPNWWPRSLRPWSPEAFDTMLEWAGHNGYISMDELCFALGIEGKGDIDGSMVAELWASGEYEKINAYCASDVEKVRAIYRKMRVPYDGREKEDALPF